MFSKQLFGTRLKEIRLNNGDLQRTLAKLLGVSAAQISEMENGNKTTTVEKVALICEHYHISSDYLLGLTDKPRTY